MNDPHYLNPQIFPSNKNLKPADHHRILYSSVAILLCASLVGGVYWWRTPEDVPPEITVNPREELIANIQQRPKSQASAETVKNFINNHPPLPQEQTASSTEARARLVEEIRLRIN
jgi:hypothetical protein